MKSKIVPTQNSKHWKKRNSDNDFMNYLNIFWKSVQSYPAVQSNPTLPVHVL